MTRARGGAALLHSARFPVFHPFPTFLLAVSSASTRVTHDSLPPDKHNEAHSGLPLETFPALLAPRLPIAAAGEDTYKAQYRYPYRDIPNIVAGISSVSATWDACLNVARYARVVRRCGSCKCVIYRREYIRSRSGVAEKARFDKSKNKRTLLSRDTYLDRLRLTGCSRVRVTVPILSLFLSCPSDFK